MNVLEYLKDHITPEIVKKTATALQETPENTQRGFEAMMHTLTGGLIKRTTTTMGLNQLNTQIQTSGYDAEWLAKLPELLGKSDQFTNLVSKGGSLTSQLFPAMKSQISGMVLGISGLRSSSASSLISIATPMVVAALGKIVRERQLSDEGLAEFLYEQRENLVQNTSPELMDKMVNVLALQDIIGGKVQLPKISSPTPVTTVQSTERNILKPPVFEEKKKTSYEVKSEVDPENEGGGSNKWFIVALVAVVAAVGGIWGWQYYNGQPKSIEDETSIVTDTVKVAVDTTKVDSTRLDSSMMVSPVIDSAQTAAVPTDSLQGAKVKIPAGVKSAFAKSIAAAKVGDAIKITTIDYVPNSAEQVLTSDQAVADLARLLAANPGLQLKIINLSNDAVAPQTNKSLSISRAYDLKKRLMVAGVNPIRIDAAGIGSGANNANLKQVMVKVISK